MLISIVGHPVRRCRGLPWQVLALGDHPTTAALVMSSTTEIPRGGSVVRPSDARPRRLRSATRSRRTNFVEPTLMSTPAGSHFAPTPRSGSTVGPSEVRPVAWRGFEVRRGAVPGRRGHGPGQDGDGLAGRTTAPGRFVRGLVGRASRSISETFTVS